MARLAKFQDDFSRALFGSEAAVPAWAAQPGFAVYRNTVMKGCIDALQANFPTVARLAGETWFRSAAAVFVPAHPARDPCLLAYGAEFPEFLSTFEPARAVPYLPAVARLDRLRTECHVAADAVPLDAQALAGISPEQLGAAVLALHPAARWIWFDELPAFSIWRANNEPEVSTQGMAWQGEGVVLTRPLDAVRWAPLNAGGIAFLDACRRALPLASAAENALGRAPDTDLSRLLAALLQAGAFAAPDELPA